MFLEALKKQNSALIECAVTLLRKGLVLPDTYVVDVDQFRENAKLVKQQADKFGIKLLAMTKQIGRNPVLARILIEECGYQGVVCVDYKEAIQFHQQGIKISHVGHLVQPPSHFIESLVRDITPEVITVYSIEKAQEISDAAKKANRIQSIILKFFEEGDALYPNQESGFPLTSLSAVVGIIRQLPNLKIDGITHFPCFLYDEDAQQVKPTRNLHTALSAIKEMERAGMEVIHRNFPSATCCETLPLIHRYGGTHGEPGHALTGTMPSNRKGDQPEKVAMAYVTEVSHVFEGRTYCYGGGNYGRSHIEGALVFEDAFPAGRFMPICPTDAANIDYYFQLDGGSSVGSPVIMSFRTQIFVTRSDVALVEGITSSAPRLLGIFDTQGREIVR